MSRAPTLTQELPVLGARAAAPRRESATAELPRARAPRLRRWLRSWLRSWLRCIAEAVRRAFGRRRDPRGSVLGADAAAMPPTKEG